MSRSWTAASLLVVIALYAMVTRQWAPSAVTAALLLGAILTHARLDVSPTVARFATALAATAGVVFGWIAPALPGLDILHRPWPPLALAALFVGVARLYVAPAVASRPSALALLPGLVALAAAGETGVGAPYGVAVLAWLAFALLALRAGDVARPAWASVPRRDRLVAAAIVGLAALLAAGGALALPPLSLWTERRILRSLGDAETGFSDRLWLGSLDGLVDSEEVVMRVEGPRTDYLRGAVYDEYDSGRWGRAAPPRSRPVALAGDGGEGDPRPGRVRVTLVSGARDRYFLPLAAHGVATPIPSGATVDRYGVARVAEGLAAEVSFDPGGVADFKADDPSAYDLALPPPLRAPLKALATEWTAGAETPQARVEAIATRLRTRFTYARSFQRRGADPLLAFLRDDHRGHCEYFASATALLARAAGVPARVVVGYRVAEENALGGYHVVREKNAHAWAEVYLPGQGFVTVDATPSAGLDQNAPHRLGMARAIADLLSAWWARAVERLTLRDVVLGGGAVTVGGLAVRWLRGRRPGDGGRREARRAAGQAPPGLVRLFEALARRGLVRGEAEPIERFAARIEEKEGSAAEAAALLRRWAAFRYGGIGDGAGLARELDGCAESLRRR